MFKNLITIHILSENHFLRNQLKESYQSYAQRFNVNFNGENLTILTTSQELTNQILKKIYDVVSTHKVMLNEKGKI